MSVNLANNVDVVRLRNGDVVSVAFNYGGREGYLVDCVIGYDDNGNALSWNLDGSSMDGDNDFDIVEVVSYVAKFHMWRDNGIFVLNVYQGEEDF